MDGRLTQHSNDDGNSSRMRTFGIDGAYNNCDVSQGNTYNVRGNMFMGSPSPDEPDFKQLQIDFLKHLHFGEITRRHEHVQSLVDDFGLTCRWILTPGKDHGFLSWYTQENGPFWISGLAGTGKSTLMDFIGQELPLDDNWSESDRVLQHFFSSAKGTTVLEKSCEGLYRSICYQILADTDSKSLLQQLIQDLPTLPALRSLYKTFSGTAKRPWTMRNLAALLDYLAKRSTTKYLLLLDGLDECCDDGHEDLLQRINWFIDLGMKVVCSSRPQEPFSSALADTVHFKLQDVNAGDIRNFCTAKLQHTKASYLVNEIVENSEGIFLWAGIVTIDLRRECRLYTDVELRKRLRQCPRGMIDLYEHMLSRCLDNERLGWLLPPYLLVIKTCIELGLPDQVCSINLLLLIWTGILLEDDTEDFSRISEPIWLEAFREKTELIADQVLTKCSGFVHLKISKDWESRLDVADVGNADHSLTFSDGVHQMAQMLLDQKILFVHKTALEFLCEKSVEDQLWKNWAVSKADIVLAMCKFFISVPCNWNNPLLRLKESTNWRLRGIELCTQFIEPNLKHQNELYYVVSRLLQIPSCDNVFGEESIAHSMKKIFNHRKTMNIYVYDQSLSMSQNNVSNWIASYLDVNAFIKHFDTEKIGKDDFVSGILVSHLVNPHGSACHMIFEPSSLHKEFLKKTYILTRYWTMVGFGINRNPTKLHLECIAATFWTCLFSSWLSHKLYSEGHGLGLQRSQTENPNPVHDAMRWIVQLDRSLLKEKIALGLAIEFSYSSSRGKLSLSPEYNIRASRSFCSQPRKVRAQIFVFGIKLVPDDMLPSYLTDQKGKRNDSMIPSSLAQFTYLAIGQCTTVIPISAETSEKLCMLTGLNTDYLNGLYSTHEGRPAEAKAAFWQVVELITELVRTNEHRFDTESGGFSRALEVAEDAREELQLHGGE